MIKFNYFLKRRLSIKIMETKDYTQARKAFWESGMDMGSLILKLREELMMDIGVQMVKLMDMVFMCGPLDNHIMVILKMV